MSGYKAITTSPVSQQQAEEFGAWLGEYAVRLSGLTVYQVGASGKRHRDNATERTIKEVATQCGMAQGSAPAAAPLLGPLLAPLAPVLTPIAAISLPFLVKAQHSLNKRTPYAPEPIDHTEIEWSLANVSAERLDWVEDLLAIYAAQDRHGWTLLGATQRAVAYGQRYAAAYPGHYPRPWSQRAKAVVGVRGKSSPPRRPAQGKGQKRAVRGRSLREWLEDL